MLVTILNEMIAAAFRSRAKWLRFGIERMVGSQWMEPVYAHPLIEGTAQDGNIVAKGRDGPSYIPSRSFANVLMSIIQQNSPGFVELQRALRKSLDAAASAGATVESFKAQLSATAAQIQTAGESSYELSAA